MLMQIARRLGNAALLAMALTIAAYTWLDQAAAHAQNSPIAVVPAIKVVGEEHVASQAVWLQPVTHQPAVAMPVAVLLLAVIAVLAIWNTSRIKRSGI